MTSKRLDTMKKEVEDISDSIELIEEFNRMSLQKKEELVNLRRDLSQLRQKFKNAEGTSNFILGCGGVTPIIVLSVSGGEVIVPLWLVGTWVATVGTSLFASSYFQQKQKKLTEEIVGIVKNEDLLDKNTSKLKDAQNMLEEELDDRKNMIAMRVLKKENKTPNRKKDND
jgi:hypothetical protein